MWLQYRASYVCKAMTIWCNLYLFIGNISLTSVDEDLPPGVIKCPGDVIQYNCVIQSSTGNISLTWHVIVPGLTPISITYDEYSSTNTVDLLDMNVTTILTSLERNDNNQSIESVIMLVQPECQPRNATILLKCAFMDLLVMSLPLFQNLGKESCNS